MTVTVVSTTNAVRTGTCLRNAEVLRTVTALQTLNAANTSTCLVDHLSARCRTSVKSIIDQVSDLAFSFYQ